MYRHTCAIRRSKPCRNGGYTLIEMLAYVAILGMVINICASVLLTGSRLSALGTLALDRMNGVAEVERAFVDAVRASSGVIGELGSYRSGNEQVVLRAAPRDGHPRYVVLGTFRDDARLSKMELVDRDGTLEMAGFTTYRQPITSLRIHYDASTPEAARRVGMDFAIAREPGERAGRTVIHRAMARPRAVLPAGVGLPAQTVAGALP